MPRREYIPIEHRVYNEFDSHGDLLGLGRLTSERNPEYKSRLFDVFVNRSGSSYRGLINGITRELGLSMYEPITIITPTNGAIIFEETKCILYSDFANQTVLKTIERFNVDAEGYSIQNLVDAINTTSTFSATILNSTQADKRSMTIINQSSIKLVIDEPIGISGARITLKNRNLIEGTISIRSENLIRRVSLEANLRQSGDYLIDTSNGIILTVGVASGDSIIRYQYREDEFKPISSPIIIHNLQSTDFQTKMYEQILDENNNEVNGLPTYLGADIINELMSVFPTNWGA